jgi:hypothetical protein
MLIENRISRQESHSKEQTVEDFQVFLSSIPCNNIQVYSDESKLEAKHSTVGYGAIAY